MMNISKFSVPPIYNYQFFRGFQEMTPSYFENEDCSVTLFDQISGVSVNEFNTSYTNGVLTNNVPSGTSINQLYRQYTGVPTGLTSTDNSQYCPNYFSYTAGTNPSGGRIRPLQGGLRLKNTINSESTLGMICVDNDTNSVVGLVCYSQTNPDELCANWSLPTFSDPTFSQGNDFIGVTKKISMLKRVPKFNDVNVSLITISSSDFDSSVSWKPYGLTGITNYIEFANSNEIDSLLGSGLYLWASCGGGGGRGQGVVKLKVCGQGECRLGSNYGIVNFENILYFQASGTTTPSGLVCAYPSWGFCCGEPLIANFGGTYKYVGITAAIYQIGDGTNLGYQVGVAIRMDKIANYLNISPYTGQTVNFSDINNIKYFYEDDITSSITKVLSGNTYWQTGTYQKNT